MKSNLFEALDKTDRVMALGLAVCAGVFVILMMLHIVAGIVARQILGAPLGGVTEIVSAYDMVAVTFLPLAYVTRNKGHISVVLFTHWLSTRSVEIIEWLASLFIALISIWVFYESSIAAIESFAVREVWESGDGFLYVWPSRVFVPLGIGAMAFSLTVETLCRSGHLLSPANSVSSENED